MKRINRQLLKIFNFKRLYSQDVLQKKIIPVLDSEIHLPEPEYDIDFWCNPFNRDLIVKNISKRKSHADINRILQLHQNSHSQEELINEIRKIPNLTDPKVLEYKDNEPCVLRKMGEQPTFRFKPQEFSQIMARLKLLKSDRLGPVTGSKSYILMDDLAELEQALVKYTIKELLKNNFHLISVPDILPSQVIERCGLISDGERKLVYELEPFYGDDLSLSGTAEMALAYKLSNKIFSPHELPLKLAAVSRCYRAEISQLADERGIYRVHQFTKVEMFVCSDQEKSIEIMDQIVALQEKLFGQLGLYYQVLDMPPNELGSPAYRKIDIEAWMVGRKKFGEVSSCSNCTDYQARRLNIKYKTKDDQILHVHTLNGTACAVPRMLIAICETHQKNDNSIAVPKVLQEFMNGKSFIQKSDAPRTKVFKSNQKVN
ncbi:serine--tRNA ligase, mitochondrial [Copidosoma floridanum]|uniref:serine--tRNA ligase, mitochondrial n=1 Tax=Copidosoma floridanum TaxID=29053 RepID=UPI0006C979DC|nr:serine--tRNA ligase, mitochondrial [Copidosoma floridanum]